MSTSVINSNPKNIRVDRNIAKVKTNSPHYSHIDGLRGLAILLVVIFHIFVGKVSSGVDIFLLIGGIFFISAHIRNASKKDGMTFFQSVIRLLRRLAPSLILVSFSSAIYLLITTKSVSWLNMFYDLSASVSYWTNWRLVEKQLEYTAATEGASLFQHLWSMSVQMQSYIFMMIVIYSIFFICKKKRKNIPTVRNIVVMIFIILTIASFIYASYEFFYGNQNKNYYSTYSRFWEIGLGGIVGIYLNKITPKKTSQRWILSIVGIFMVISTGIFMNGVESFPGPLTLYPVAGALMIILSGVGTKGNHRTSIIREYGPVIWFLSTPFMKFFGNIAYNLYLWHWVFLIVYINILGRDNITLIEGIFIIASSIIVATVAYYFVEMPLRQKEKPERGNVFSLDYIRNARATSPSLFYPFVATIVALTTIITATSPFMYKSYIHYTTQSLNRQIQKSENVEKDYPGGQAAIAGLNPKEKPIFPNIVDLPSMMPPTTSDGCYSGFGNTNLELTKNNGDPCEYGDIKSDKTMYVIGGSHSEQFIPALEEIGKRNGFKIIPLIKMGCPLYQNSKNGENDFTECSEDWSPKAEQYIMDNHPTEGIFDIGTRASTFWGSPPEIVPDFYIDFYKRMSNAGIPIYSLRDNAWITNHDGPFDPRECVYTNGRNSESCKMNSTYFSPEDPSIQAYQGIPNIKLLDLTNAYVVGDKINPVIGNVLVYRDSHHLTKQFVQTITNALEHQMKTNKWSGGTTNTTKESLVLEGFKEQSSSSSKPVPQEIIIPGQTAEEVEEVEEVDSNV